MLGMQTLTYSASFYEDDEAEETKTDKLLNKVTKGNAEKVFMGFTVAFSIVLAVAIFIALPYGISLLFHSYVRNASLLAILEGVVRLAIFLAYVAIIASMKDIRRVYQYHGCLLYTSQVTALMISSVSCVSRQMGTALTPPNSLKRTAFPSMTGIAA